MKYVSLALISFLIGCGSEAPKMDSPNPAPPTSSVNSEAAPFFQAYGCYTCPKTGPYGEGEQVLTSGELIKILSEFSYLPDVNPNYDTAKSSFLPKKQGLYYVDQQLYVQGVYSANKVQYRIQISMNNHGQLWYDDERMVEPGQITVHKLAINTLLCMDGVNDHTESYVAVSSGSDVRILNTWSQFEGYYVGPCNPKEP